MIKFRPGKAFGRLVERESMRPDLGRAIRCTFALMAPLLLATSGRLPVEAAFAVLAAQNVAMADVRGAYSLRFTLLLTVAFVLAGCAGLGGLLASHLPAAVAGMALVAVGGGLWRHLSADYGPSVAVSSSLIYVIALAGAGGASAAGHHLLATLAGGLWGVLLQVAFWPVRPQHPLRRAVGDSWLAAAEVYTALAPDADLDAEKRHRRIADAEAALRTALDQTDGALASASAKKTLPWVSRLEDLHRAAARLALRVGAFNTAMEALMAEPGFASLAPSFQTVLTVMTNMARTVALAVVSRQPGHLAACDVRLQRLENLLRVLQARVRARTESPLVAAQLAEVLRQIEDYLPVVGESLRATIGRSDERIGFPLELFDLDVWRMRPLASALNLRSRVDPAIVRHSARIAVLTMLGVVAFKCLHLPHGYWLPFTMVVVLQPDYGATRQRAVQRMLGTLAGSVLASLTLWMHLPFAALMAATAAAGFVFVYLLKRNYGIAVVFITLFVVLLTESSGPVELSFTVERLASTVAGGLLALLAALMFWPVWERERFPPIFAEALRANGDYLRVLAAHLSAGRGYDRETSHAKRRAERANSEVFSSLRRMTGDPRNRQERVEQVAALANGNQRLTRVLNLLSVHLAPGAVAAGPEVAPFAATAGEALEALARGIAGAAPNPAYEDLRRRLDGTSLPGATGARDGPAERRRIWIFSQLSRAATELSAMLLEAEPLLATAEPAVAGPRA
jgi:uncharacterized membrane protein YccC